MSSKKLDKLQAEKGETMTPGQELGRKILERHEFDNTMGVIIVFNIFVMVVETDRAADDAPDEEGHWTAACGWVILISFILELVLRLFVFRMGFWKEPLNVFDFAVVAIDTVFSVLGVILGSFFPVSILRVCRLAKLARVSKVLRVFPELRIMMAGLIGSVSAIFWGTVLLLIFLLVWSIIAVQFIHPISREMDWGECERCPRAFGDVASAMLTISQTTVLGDSWGAMTVPIIEAHPQTIPFFSMVFLSVGLGVLNLILGVVCNVFTLAHDRIVAEIEEEKIVLRMETKNHLLDLCKGMDTDDSGELTKEELVQGFAEHEEFRTTLAQMDISEEDLEILWSILDSDKSGAINYGEFVSQVYTMTYSDTQFMLAYIRYYVTQIRDTIISNIKDSEVREEAEMKIIENEIKHMDDEVKKMEGEQEVIMEELHGVDGKKAETKGGETCDTDYVQASPEKKNGLAAEVQQANEGLPTLPEQRYDDIALRHDSAKMQKELEDIAISLRISLDQQIVTISSLLQDFVPSRKASDLLVVPIVPNKSPSCVPFFCASGRTTPDERKVLIPSSTGSPDKVDSPGAPSNLQKKALISQS